MNKQKKYDGKEIKPFSSWRLRVVLLRKGLKMRSKLYQVLETLSNVELLTGSFNVWFWLGKLSAQERRRVGSPFVSDKMDRALEVWGFYDFGLGLQISKVGPGLTLITRIVLIFSRFGSRVRLLGANSRTISLPIEGVIRLNYRFHHQ